MTYQDLDLGKYLLGKGKRLGGSEGAKQQDKHLRIPTQIQSCNILESDFISPQMQNSNKGKKKQINKTSNKPKPNQTQQHPSPKPLSVL